MIKELTNEEFYNFCLTFKDKSIYQTPEYAFVMNKQGFDSILLGMTNSNNELIAASLILIEKKYGFKYAYAPRGFLIDYDNEAVVKSFTCLIKKYLGKLDIIAIKICPMIYKNIMDSKNNIVKINNNFENNFKLLRKLEYYHLGFNNSFEALKPRFVSVIPLNSNYTKTFNDLSKPLKTKIRGAEKKGIVIHKGNKSNLEYLYFQTKRKYPRDLKYFEDTYEFFNKKEMAEFYYAKMDTSIYLNNVRKEYQKQLDLNNKVNEELLISKKNNTKLINKKIELDKSLNNIKNELIYATNLNRENPNGLIVASAFIIKNTDSATLLMDGYDPKFKRVNAKHLLIWKLIERYSKEGLKQFNLGGINNPLAPQSRYKGLNDFKLSFNSSSIEYIGDLELITNKALYFIYRNSSPIRKILKK